MSRRWGEAHVVVDMFRAQHEGPVGLARRRSERLTALVAHARTKSPFYRDHYAGQPLDPVVPGGLPPVTKPELMASFDDWVTDPRIRRSDVEAFVADPGLIGTPYRGEFFVCTSSGTTGHPALFVHDRNAIAVYRAVIARLDRTWLSPRQWVGVARRGFRLAVVVGSGGHFAAAGWLEFERHRSAWRRRAYRVFSVQRPLTETVAALNAFDPAILSAYPSALELLADERSAGRLRVRPTLVETGGETLLPDVRTRMRRAFGSVVRDVYGASEFDPIAFSCDYDWLHVNSDWVMLEPVDADLRPTPAGQESHTVLITNLANRVQPIIRYDLGDSVLARPDPCPCGLRLPAIRVAGRRDDVLRLAAEDGRAVSVLPLAIGSLIDAIPGVARSQVLQTGPAAIRLRLRPQRGADVEAVWLAVTTDLRAFLRNQGLGNVAVIRAAEPPAENARSGKFRRVMVS